jgi:hypothetical protein
VGIDPNAIISVLAEADASLSTVTVARSKLRFGGSGETAFVVAYFLLLALLLGLLVNIGVRLRVTASYSATRSN